jgi:hypothetical protein
MRAPPLCSGNGPKALLQYLFSFKNHFLHSQRDLSDVLAGLCRSRIASWN